MKLFTLCLIVSSLGCAMSSDPVASESSDLQKSPNVDPIADDLITDANPDVPNIDAVPVNDAGKADMGSCSPNDPGTHFCPTLFNTWVCVDLYTDPNHCGNCNIKCPQGQICTFGQCNPPADTGSPNVDAGQDSEDDHCDDNDQTCEDLLHCCKLGCRYFVDLSSKEHVECVQNCNVQHQVCVKAR